MLSSSEKERQAEINDVLRHFKLGGKRAVLMKLADKGQIWIPVETNQSLKHFLGIAETAYEVASEGGWGFAGFPLKNGYRPDWNTAYPKKEHTEVAVSESEESLVEKMRHKYPFDVVVKRL